MKILSKAKNVARMIPGARRAKAVVLGSGGDKEVYLHCSTPDEREKPAALGHEELKSLYQASAAADVPDSFVLYRIIGNDLIPRHAKGQSRSNVAFILENEAELADCEKRFVVNRIVDPGEEEEIIEMLDSAGLPYLHIPFDWEEYKNIPLDVEGIPEEYLPYSKKFSMLSEAQQSRIYMRLYRHKNNYVMNNNGARNAALREGKSLAKWVLPWDGNCFVTVEAWQEIVKDVTSRPEHPYFIVPMARLTDNESLFEQGFQPEAKEEPQVAFRCDSSEEFSSECYYGRRPKVELFWRLGIPGSWDRWLIEPWDLPCPSYSPGAGAYASAGWVARLFSGQAHLENTPKGLVDRGVARNNAIGGLLKRLDDEVFKQHYAPETECFVGARLLKGGVDDGIDAGLAERLEEAANEALGRGPYSVVDKKTLPPSKNPHDYWHPAPYYWPNPIPIPGLPYLPRDGQRVPGTRLYEPMSDNYDRTRLQRLFDDVFVLALAGITDENGRFDQHAAKLVRNWFIDPSTAMNPHLLYAQVRRGWNGNRGSSSGVIEAKDFYFFLDGIRLLERRGALKPEESSQLRKWFGHYLHWLRTSSQGIKERSSTNNHGTYYDLQVAAISAFLGDSQLLLETLQDSQCRIVQQFTEDGMQPEEMKRTTTAHYCCFNLQGWIHLAELAETYGIDLWSFSGPNGQSLRNAMEWLLPYVNKEWPYQQINDFDKERLYPIYYAYKMRYGTPPSVDDSTIPKKNEVNPLFFPHDGIRPFWQL